MFIGDWQWLDLANIPGVLDWIGFIVGGIGLGFALVQLYSSRGALSAAKRALDRARESLIRDQIIVLLPAFNEIVASLSESLRLNEREVAIETLHRFSEKAREAEVLLDNHSVRHSAAVKELRDARVSAAFAVDRLYSEPEQTTNERVGNAATLVRSVAVTLNGVHVLVRNEIGSGNDA